MPVTVSKMSGILTLNSRGFTTGLARAGKRAKAFTAGLVGSVGKVAAFGGAIAGVAGIAGIGVLTKNSLAAIDATSKVADSVGTTTEKLTGLQHAAGIAGASSEALNKGLRFLNKTVGETVTGISTEGKVAFEALGVSLKELEGLDTADQFVKIADKLGSIEGAAERAAIAQRLFGRGGQQLMNLMLEQEGGIKALAAEADALGITFDRAAGAKVEAANDALTRLGAVFTGLSNQIAIQLAPFITKLSDKIVALTKSGGGMGAIVSSAFEKIAKGGAFVADLFTGLKGVFNLTRAAILFGLGKILQGINKVGEGIVWLLNKIPGVTATMGKSFEGFADVLVEEALRIGEMGLGQFEDALAGKSSAAVGKFFKSVQAEADMAANKIADKSAERLKATMAANLDPVVKKKTAKTAAERTASFLQGKASRIAFGGEAGPKKKLAVEADPNELSALARIERAIIGQKAVRTT